MYGNNRNLRTLRTLCIVNCKLENISSSLKNMRKLEILALLDTNIHELPEELAELPRLRSLYLSQDGGQQLNFPPNLLSRLTSLQELHVTSENNINLLELNSLLCLNALSLRVSSNQCSQENFTFPKLKRYVISVNHLLGFLKEIRFRTLKIIDLSSSLSAFKDLFCNVKCLTLCNVSEQKNIVPNIVQEGENELTSLQLSSCKDMEFLIDITQEQGLTVSAALHKLKEVIVEDCERLQVVFQIDRCFEEENENQTPLFSNLTSLYLDSLPELKSIWKLEPSLHAIASLKSLKVVTVYDCNKLKSIFSPCLAQSLIHLQSLEISSCDELEQVFNSAQEEEMVELKENLSNLTCLNLHGLPKLRCIWGGSSCVNLQSLNTLNISDCEELASLLSYTSAQTLVNLEGIYIWECSSLKFLITEVENKNEICTSSIENHYPLCWPKLKSVVIEGCPQLIQVFNLAKEKDGQDIAPHGLELQETLSNLTCLNLRRLPKLRCIWGGSNCVNLRSLKTMIIDGCEELASLLSYTSARTLVNLEELQILQCSSLEILITEVEKKNEICTSSMENHYPLCWPKLKAIRIAACQSLKYVFPNTSAQGLPCLKSVEIDDCPQLIKVFNLAIEKDGQDIALPGLELQIARFFEQDTTEGSATAISTAHKKIISWTYRAEGKLPH